MSGAPFLHASESPRSSRARSGTRGSSPVNGIKGMAQRVGSPFLTRKNNLDHAITAEVGPVKSAPTKKRPQKEPKDASKWSVEVSALNNFLLRVAEMVTTTPRKKEVNLYLIVLLCYTTNVMLNVSLTRDSPLYNFQATLKDALFDEEFHSPDLEFKKTFYDIEEEAELWQWLEGPVLHAFWDPAAKVKLLRRYNHPIVVVLLRQLRIQPEECEYESGLPREVQEYLYPDYCYPDYDRGSLSSEVFGERWYSDADKGSGKVVPSNASDVLQTWIETHHFRMVTPIWGKLYSYDPTDDCFTIPLVVHEQSYQEVKDRLQHLKHSGWIDKQTRLVIMETIVFNPNLNTFSYLRAWTEIGASGAMVPASRLRNFHLFTLETHVSRFLLILDIAVCLYYFYETYRLVQKAYHVWIIRRDVTYMFTFWHIVTFVDICLMAYAYTWRFMGYTQSASLDDEQWDIHAGSTNMGARWAQLAEYAYTYEIAVDFYSLNACLIWFRVLSFVQHIPKLSLLTDTVRRASGELMGVLMLSFFVFMGYSLMACTLYGYDLHNYSTLGRTMAMLTRIALDIGNFEYEEMYFLHPLLTIFFFGTFIFFSWVLLVNMLLAVITEAFVRSAQAKRSNSDKQMDFQILFATVLATVKKYYHQTRVLMGRGRKTVGEATGPEEKVGISAFIGKLDKHSKLLVEFRETVHSAEAIRLLAMAINRTAKVAEKEKYITYDSLLTLFALDSDAGGTLLTEDQLKIIANFFLLRGFGPGTSPRKNKKARRVQDMFDGIRSGRVPSESESDSSSSSSSAPPPTTSPSSTDRMLSASRRTVSKAPPPLSSAHYSQLEQQLLAMLEVIRAERPEHCEDDLSPDSHQPPPPPDDDRIKSWLETSNPDIRPPANPLHPTPAPPSISAPPPLPPRRRPAQSTWGESDIDTYTINGTFSFPRRTSHESVPMPYARGAPAPSPPPKPRPKLRKDSVGPFFSALDVAPSDESLMSANPSYFSSVESGNATGPHPAAKQSSFFC